MLHKFSIIALVTLCIFFGSSNAILPSSTSLLGARLFDESKSNLTMACPSYGQLGVPSPFVCPGARAGAGLAVDSKGVVWVRCCATLFDNLGRCSEEPTCRVLAHVMTCSNSLADFGRQ